jgi:predicted nucleic acid-binding protein
MASEPSSFKPRVMVDTTDLVAGIVWPRFPYEVLQHALHGDFDLVLCPVVIAEARSKFSERFPTFVQSFEDFLENAPYEEVPDPGTEEVLANETLMRDVTDVPVALSAITAEVDYFVSDDKDYTAPNQLIHEKLRVRLSGTFLNEVMGWSHEELELVRLRRWADLTASIG